MKYYFVMAADLAALITGFVFGAVLYVFAILCVDGQIPAGLAGNIYKSEGWRFYVVIVFMFSLSALIILLLSETYYMGLLAR